ncbi:MAG: hypothetical protein WBG42_03380, partial [Cryomorphaceae bacterium]
MKKFLPFFLFFYISISLSAQILNEQWATTIINDAGVAYEELAVVYPHENGTIVAGKSSSPLGYDMYVANYDISGQLIWEEYVDTPGSSEFTHIAADGNGNYYLVGFEIQFQFFSRKMHLVKINANGEVQWQTEYSGPENIHGWAKDFALANGKLLICGIEDQPDGFDSGFVAQFNTDGELEWDGDFNPGLGNELTSITASPNGNVTAVGYADGEYSLYAIQYDANGNTNWTFPETFSGEDEIWFSDIASDQDGNLYTMVTAETGFFEQSIFTQKRNNDFDLIWEHTFDSGEPDEGLSLALGNDGSVYSFIREDVSFDFHARVIKLDEAGNEVFSVLEDIGNNTDFEIGVLGDNDQIFLGMETTESYGITSLTSNGTLIGSETYDLSEINYLSGMAAGGGSVVTVGRENSGFNSAIFSLSATDLSEEYFITTGGDPLPDAKTGKIVADGADIWLSTFGDSQDDGTFTISKLDPSGNVDWEYSLVYPSLYPEFLQLEPDGNGNIIGLYQNSLNIQEGYYGLLKLDGDGNEIFNVYVDDNDENYGSALCVDPEGNSYVAGYNGGTKLMFLERYDANGNFQWQVTYESPSPSFPFSRPQVMQFTDQGKVVIGAAHRGANDVNNLHLFQYTTEGTLEWNEDVLNQTGNSVEFLDMEIESNGDIYVFGNPGFGYVAAKFTANGEEDWTFANTISAAIQAPRSMTRDDAGNLYLCFNSASDASFIKLDPSGNMLLENSVTTSSTGAFYYTRESAVIDDHLVVLGDHLFAEYGIVGFQMVLSDALEPLYVAIDSV